MAPEAERGDELDARADQYSFCAALRAALAGCEAPTWLGSALGRGLDADPARRYPSLAALVDVLERGMRPRRWWIAPAIGSVLGVLAIPLWLAAHADDAVLAPPRVCPPPELPALQVDAAAPAGGNGSKACPFRTVTEALAVPAEPRVVHVAAGRYDVAHGEKLPLIVRGATEIRGAGAELTVIAGLGPYDPRPDGIAASRFPLRAALVIGDERADVVLSGLSVEGDRREVATGSVGILCARGNLRAFEGPLPPPNTRLERVHVGAGHETGLIVTGGSAPRLTGCNLSVVSGFFHDMPSGIWQVGCGQDQTAAAPTALEVSRSSFRGIRTDPPGQLDDAGVGIMVWDCASGFRVVDSLFTSSDCGLRIVRHRALQDGASRDPHEPAMVVERNEFGGLGRYGIFLDRAVQVELLHNSLYRNPAALIIDASSDDPPSVRARHNRFGGNGVAVAVRGRGALSPQAVIDFGRAGDPGRNGFNCNGAGGAAPGATFGVSVPAARGTRLQLAGNEWDHVPPRVRRSFSTRDRAEVVLTAGAVELELEGATSSAAVCARP
jgi:Protein of unknown function (DUF1565)